MTEECALSDNLGRSYDSRIETTSPKLRRQTSQKISYERIN